MKDSSKFIRPVNDQFAQKACGGKKNKTAKRKHMKKSKKMMKPKSKHMKKSKKMMKPKSKHMKKSKKYSMRKSKKGKKSKKSKKSKKGGNNHHFITDEDIAEFEDFNNDFPKFCKELHQYLTNRWVGDGEVLDEDELKSKNDIAPLLNCDIEEFNRNIGYPSREAERELDAAFTGGIREGEFQLSDTSKEYLEYFYGIRLH